MTKTYNVPVENKDGTRAVEQREYKPMALVIRGKRIRFAIQQDFVAHYASGYRIARFQDIKIERMARISHHTRTTDRQAAVIAILRLIERVGEDVFLAKLASVPVINH